MLFRRVRNDLFCVVVACSILTSGWCWAGQGENNATLLQEMVVTATKFPTPQERVPGRIDVITAQEIEHMPYERVDELLESVSGVQTDRTGGIFELSPRVTMRGLGGNVPGRTLVLIDGQPASIGDSGNMRWNRVNLADIERIEIFKGPGSSIYGSNAMGGVINIITKRPESEFSGEISGGYGSFNTVDGSARIGGRQSMDQGLYAQLAASGLDSDGYTSLTKNSKDYPNRIDRFVEEFTVNTKLGYALDERNSLELTHSYFDDRRGEGYKYNLSEGSHRDFDTNSWHLLHKGGHHDWHWNVNGFYQKEEYFWHRDFANPASLYTVNSDREDYGTTLSLARDFGDYNTLTFGADARFSAVDATDDYDNSNDYADNQGDLDQYAVYVQDELRLLNERLILMAGLRYDTARFHDGAYDSNIPPFDALSTEMDDNSWDALSPKLSARYRYSQDLSLYASYSRGFRAPILDALCRYGIFHGRFYDANPDLENETLDSFEIGADAVLAENLDLGLSSYYSRGRDFIYSVDTGQTRFLWGKDRAVYLMDNVTEVQVLGLEADLTYDFRNDLQFFSNYTYNESTIEEFNERPDLEGKRLEYVPKHSFSAGVTFLHPWLNCRLVWNYVGEQYADDVNTETLDAYDTVDLKLWRDLDFLVPGLSANLNIQNLLDEEYLRSEDAKDPGIFVVGRLEYTW